MSEPGGYRRRQWRLQVFIGAAALAAILLFLSLVPTMRYVPSCGARISIPLEGPVRERFLILMSQVFQQEGVSYLRSRDGIYLRYFAFFDGNDLFDRHHVLLNFQWKMVSVIAQGVTIDDVYFPPPERLVEAIRATEGKYGPYPKRTEEGEPIGGFDARFSDCELMRAAMIDDDPS